MRVFERFLGRLPVRRFAPRADRAAARRRGRRAHPPRRAHCSSPAAATLAVLGFLGYYLPVYAAPQLLPRGHRAAAAPRRRCACRGASSCGRSCSRRSSSSLLTLLNIVGVHEIAVATGFLTPETKPDRMPALLSIGLERKTTEVTRYGIDPFEGLHPWMLFLFNLVLRLKGWLANQAVRYLVRLLLGRYAVRALLDFAGVPLYMAINAYAAHAVLREAKVVLMGPEAIRALVRRALGGRPLPGRAGARLRHAPVHRGQQARLPPEPLPPDARAAGAAGRCPPRRGTRCRRTTSSVSPAAPPAGAGALPGAHPVGLRPGRPAVLARAPPPRRDAAPRHPLRPSGGRAPPAPPVPRRRRPAARRGCRLSRLSTGRGGCPPRCTRPCPGRTARSASSR